MAPKLIPIKLLSSGDDSVSFMGNGKVRGGAPWLAKSIKKDGLLNPLVVTQQGNKFIVIDGKKRLAVMQQMAKARHLGKAIAKVPCIVQGGMALRPIESRRPLLMSGPELAHEIIISVKTATSHVSIAQRFECDITVVEDCLSLPNLHPEILLHFNNKAISLEQAAAFATIENMTAQLDLLHQLGPFVSNDDIIAAIRGGATVVELSEDNIIFLPSRRRQVSDDRAAEQQQTFEFDKQQPMTALRSVRLAA